MTVELRHKLTGMIRKERDVISITDDGEYIRIEKDASKSVISCVTTRKREVEIYSVKEV